MEFIDVMRERRAVNFFDPNREVADEEVRRILETAALSPSSMNFQPWQVVVVRSREAKEKLMKAAFNQAKIVDAPVTLIILADKEGWRPGHPTVEKVWQDMVKLGYLTEDKRRGFEMGPQRLYGGEERSLAFAVKNAAFFAMAVMLAAKDLGIDSHPMDGFDHEAVRQAFNIPANFFVPVLIALGYFDQKYTLMPPKWRKSWDEIVWGIS
ncbi:MAG TPA: nitroreductase family protein [Syntrophales bacterium]|nr:nitroreductase family protein [Syntrophales bacterium]HOL58615.1 nitroreductase family protein [Syntrophales bacterium]HPO35097.1 nitroreductase family protein [Syntrophales bacterium]